MNSCDGCVHKGSEDCPQTIDPGGNWACTNGQFNVIELEREQVVSALESIEKYMEAKARMATPGKASMVLWGWFNALTKAITLLKNDGEKRKEEKQNDQAGNAEGAGQDH